MANGTAMPAVSRPRNSTVTMRICSSGPNMRSGPRQSAEAAHMGEEGAYDRDQQRRDADRHGEARYPQRRLQIGRCPFSEAIGGELELDQLPQQQCGKTK